MVLGQKFFLLFESFSNALEGFSVFVQFVLYTDIYKTVIFRRIRTIYRHTETELSGWPYAAYSFAINKRYIYVDTYSTAHLFVVKGTL